jgi:hypothetical protein
LPGFYQDDDYKKRINQVADAEWDPAKQQSLDFGENRIKPVGIIFFNKAGIKRGKFN